MGSQSPQIVEYKIDFNEVWKRLQPLKVQIGAPPDIYESPIVISYKYKTSGKGWMQGVVQINNSSCFELEEQARKPYLIKLYCYEIQAWLHVGSTGIGWVNNSR